MPSTRRQPAEQRLGGESRVKMERLRIETSGELDDLGLVERVGAADELLCEGRSSR